MEPSTSAADDALDAPYGNAAYAESHLVGATDGAPPPVPPPGPTCGGGDDAARLEREIAEAGTRRPEWLRACRAELVEGRDLPEDELALVFLPPLPMFALAHADVDTLLVLVERLLRGAEAMEAPAATAESDTERAAHDLGEVRSLDAFSRAAGDLVDAACARAGAEATLRLCANFPAGEPGVFVGIDFRMEIERDTGAVKIRTQLGVALIGRASFGIIAAFLRADLYGWMEASGDSGREAVSLLMYGIRTSVDDTSPTLAAAMFDEGWREETEREMDADDHVDLGSGYDVSGGYSAGTGREEIEVEASSGREAGRRLSRDADGRMHATDVETDRLLAVTFDEGPFSFSGELTQSFLGDRFDGLELEFSAGAAIDLRDWRQIVGALFLENVLSTAAVLIRDALGDTSERGSLAALAAHLDGITGLSLIGTEGAIEATGGDESFLSVHHQLHVTAELDAHGRFTLTVALERETELELGDSPNDPFYLQLVSTAPLLTAHAAAGGGAPAVVGVR